MFAPFFLKTRSLDFFNCFTKVFTFFSLNVYCFMLNIVFGWDDMMTTSGWLHFYLPNGQWLCVYFVSIFQFFFSFCRNWNCQSFQFIPNINIHLITIGVKQDIFTNLRFLHKQFNLFVWIKIKLFFTLFYKKTKIIKRKTPQND